MTGLAVFVAAVLMGSCRPPSSALDCNFQNWQNPSIVVGADGVDIVLFDDRTKVTMDKLSDYLSELPDRYFPRGRIVAIQEGGLRAPNTDELIRRNMEQTKQIVKSLGIQIKCPNAGVTAMLPPNRDTDPFGLCNYSLSSLMYFKGESLSSASSLPRCSFVLSIIQSSGAKA
jgi:hypothetical protein